MKEINERYFPFLSIMLNHDVYTHIQAIVLNIYTYTTSDNELVKQKITVVCLRISLGKTRSIKLVHFFPLGNSNN